MHCNNCGKQIEGDEVFCSYCGNRIKSDSSAQETPHSSESQNEQVETIYAPSQTQNAAPHTESNAQTYHAQAANGQPIVINVVNSNSNTNTNSNMNYGATSGAYAYPYKSRFAALLLCIFLGVIGAHRFYVGKIGTGVLYLLTGGLGGVGVVFDLLMIIFGAFRDKAGYPLS